VRTSVGQSVPAGTVVTFVTDDGVILSGRLFGGQKSDGAGMVPAHMYPAAPVEFKGLSAKDAVTKVLAPTLFIGAEDDAGGPGTRELGAMASEPKEVAVFPGSDHDTDLLQGDQGTAVLACMEEFLARTVVGSTP
jgi:hypothetical protein